MDNPGENETGGVTDHEPDPVPVVHDWVPQEGAMLALPAPETTAFVRNSNMPPELPPLESAPDGVRERMKYHVAIHAPDGDGGHNYTNEQVQVIAYDDDQAKEEAYAIFLARYGIDAAMATKFTVVARVRLETLR